MQNLTEANSFLSGSVFLSEKYCYIKKISEKFKNIPKAQWKINSSTSEQTVVVKAYLVLRFGGGFICKCYLIYICS